MVAQGRIAGVRNGVDLNLGLTHFYPVGSIPNMVQEEIGRGRNRVCHS